MNIVIVQWN